MLAAQFGWCPALPVRDPGAGIRERDRAVAEACDAGVLARQLAAAEAPREGDAVLMGSAYRRRPVGHHIGLWCAPGGRPSVLHMVAGLGAVLDDLDALRVRRLALIGIWRWHCAA